MLKVLHSKQMDQHKAPLYPKHYVTAGDRYQNAINKQSKLSRKFIKTVLPVCFEQNMFV